MIAGDLVRRLKDIAPDWKRATDAGPHNLDSQGGARFVDRRGRRFLFVAKPVATPTEIAHAEVRLGFALPALLATLYREVGNGGFGPGFGLLGIPVSRAEKTDDEADDIVSLYLSLRQPDPDYPEFQPWHWPERLLPICDQGCGITTCLNCAHDSLPVIEYDPNLDWNDPTRFVMENPSFEDWLRAWLSDADG